MKHPAEPCLAAILATHVTGYSRLTEAGKERALKRLKALFRRLVGASIKAHRGRIFSNPTGAGPLVEFLTAVDAVHCAGEIQRTIADRNAEISEVKRTYFGIGVAFGEMFAHGDFLSGDGVFVAAALATLAEAGGICISPIVHHQVRGTLDVPVDDWIVASDRAPAIRHSYLELASALQEKRALRWAMHYRMNGPPRQRWPVAVDTVPGSILWNPPSRMRVGHRERIEGRIADANVALEALRWGLRGRGLPQVDKLEIAPLMRVTLTADAKDFSIQTLSTQDQLIRRDFDQSIWRRAVARWDFDVTPLLSGRHRLRLLASMRIKIEGKDELIDLPSYEAEVRVAVAPVRAVGHFCAKNWQWISGTVVIPLIVWAASTTGFGSAVLNQLRAWLNL
jgi:class 3 adenylate cyclase